MSGRPDAVFLEGSLLRHVTLMSLSGTAGLGFTFLVDFLALWWIARLGDEVLIAALGFAGTIQFAVISIAIGMMIGAVALVARALGQGDRPRARRIAAAAMVTGFAVLSVVAAAVLVWRREILAFGGAEGAALDAGARFLAITLPSMPLMALAMLGAAVLRAVGDAWRSMLVTMAAGAVAALLDPVLIVWAGWGIEGAAASMVVARLAMAGAALWFVLRTHDMVARPRLADALALARPFLAIALPAVATQLSTPFGNWLLTRAMAEHGESAVAGWGVVMRLTILAFGGIFALSGAIGGIIGQNYGAGRIDRVERAFGAAILYCLVYTLLVWAAMAAAGDAIAASFGLSAEGAEVVRTFTHFAAGSFVFTGALFVANASFNTLGRPLWSTGANWFRDGLLIWPLAILFGGWMAGPGVIWAQALANVVAGLLAAALAWRYIRGLEARRGRVPLAAQ